jgi:hypothetical protein
MAGDSHQAEHCVRLARLACGVSPDQAAAFHDCIVRIHTLHIISQAMMTGESTRKATGSARAEVWARSQN